MRGRKPFVIVSDNDHPVRSPRAPATLGDVGKAEWRKVVPALAASGVLTEEMKTILTLYCEAVEGASDCAKILRKEGRIVHRRGQPPRAHPAVRQHLQYQAMALRYAESLGITATAKARQSKNKEGTNGSVASVFD
ncbi:phage terminase small subunit P27 family [Rhizobium puerariae]|uniref:Phage terminase small subunit P27 family n=1 Tax=Rhizobium puerariae TaxID=1585791 RepID=A0ABV6ANI2_9HYPH